MSRVDAKHELAKIEELRPRGAVEREPRQYDDEDGEGGDGPTRQAKRRELERWGGPKPAVTADMVREALERFRRPTWT